MSSLKRSRHNLGSTAVECEPPYVKRRTHQAINPFLPPILNDEDEDDVSSQVTNSDGATASTGIQTTSTASSAVLNVPSTSSSPLRCMSPAGGESDRMDGGSLQRIVCFGTLLDGRIKPFRALGQPKNQITSSKHPIALSLRFRTDATTVLLHTSEEIGIVDTKTAAQMKRLKEIDTSVKFEAFLGHEEEQMDCGPQQKKSSSIIPLQINVFGSDQYLDEVGSMLSDAGMFLQEPTCLNSKTTYRNPHFLTWDDISTTPLLLTAQNAPKMDFATEVEEILDSSNNVVEPCGFEQDGRIRTVLKRHQLSAVQFMIAREDEEENMLSLWEPTTINYRDGFIHKITKEKRYRKPQGSRGGILGDNMGMGKSLSLLALIMHTLDHARSSRRRCEEIRVGEGQGTSVSGATLVITPKSSTESPLYSWEQELRRHTSSELRELFYYGQGTNIDPRSLAEHDIVFTTYETVCSDANRSNTLQATPWYRVVLDEAHHIRNRTKAFQATMNLKAERRWCLTGTPVQNRLEDLFTLTEFLRFHPVENRSNTRRWILDPLGSKDVNGLNNLRLLMRTVALKRSTSSETHCGRSETEEPVELSQAEREKYSSIRAQARKTITRTGKSSSSHTLLSYILQMRQVCSHGLRDQISRPDLVAIRQPQHRQYVCNGCADVLPSSQLSRSTSNATGGPHYCPECAFEEDASLGPATDSTLLKNGVCEGMDTLVSQIDDQVSKYAGNNDVDMELDDVLQSGAESSSKIDSIMCNLIQLDQKRHNDDKPIKSLVFSCWITTLDALEAALSRCNMQYTRIDGSLALDQRRKAIERFQTEPELQIMLLSFGSGSVGLNLTAATHVHIVEPQWNPMVEAQAAARVHRIDQNKDVVIMRYIVKDSIEELIKARQRRKIWLAKLSTSTGDDANEVDGINELESLIE